MGYIMDDKIWRNKEWLESQYKDKSWNEIAKLVGKSSTTVRLAAKKLGVSSRTVSEARNLINNIDLTDLVSKYENKSIKTLAIEYNISYSVMRYKLLKAGVKPRENSIAQAVSNDNRNGLHRDLWANHEWLTARYSYSSINQIAEFVGWSYTCVHDMMVNLGVPIRNSSESVALKWEDKEYRTKHAQYLSSNPKISKIQLRLYDILDDLGIENYREGPDTLIGFWSFDCMVPNNRRNVLIEVQGEYWHHLEKAGKRDSNKFTYVDRYFPEFEVMYVWEAEFANESNLRARLLNKFRKPDSVDFSFSDLSIKLTTHDQCKSLLDSYHYLGGNRGGIAYGAFLGDKLIGVVLYSQPLRQQLKTYFESDDLLELSRMCIDPQYQKYNFCSWLISKTIKLLGSKTIVAYADTIRGHTGAIYKASNFKLHHEVPPDYWYVDDDNIVLHKKTVYNRAKSNNIKEAEYAQKYGYKKRFGGKKLAFIYQNSSKRTAIR